MVIWAVASAKWKYYTMVHPVHLFPTVCSEVMLIVDNLKLATMGVFTPWKLAGTIHQRVCFVFVVFLSLPGEPVFKYFLAQHCCVLSAWHPEHPSDHHHPSPHCCPQSGGPVARGDYMMNWKKAKPGTGNFVSHTNFAAHEFCILGMSFNKCRFLASKKVWTGSDSCPQQGCILRQTCV